MAFRTPRGYDVNRTPYQEISEGVRPSATAVPMEAWTGLPPVRVDEVHHDPIVLDAGTFVGMATGGAADGKLFPAFYISGNGEQSDVTTIEFKHSSDGATWGLPAANKSYLLSRLLGQTTPGQVKGVKPLGVVYQPIYSFQLQEQFTNYKRNENVGILTDYLIQIPCRTDAQIAMRPGDLVQVASPLVGAAIEYGLRTGITADAKVAGDIDPWDGTAAGMEYVIGRVYKNLNFATGTASTTLSSDYANISLTTAGSNEFKGLSRVQTVPGIAVAGSGTGGTPGWLGGAVSHATSGYHALTILVRL
jgi:hypothetical protein